jgi:hypothetical protein
VSSRTFKGTQKNPILGKEGRKEGKKERKREIDGRMEGVLGTLKTSINSHV